VRRRYSWVVTELFCWALGWLHYLQCVGRYYKSLAVVLSFRREFWQFVIANNHCVGQSLPIYPWKNPNIIVHIWWVRDYKMFAGHEKLVAGNAISMPSKVLFTISRGTLVGKHWCQDCLLILCVQYNGYFVRTKRRASVFYSRSFSWRRTRGLKGRTFCRWWSCFSDMHNARFGVCFQNTTLLCLSFPRVVTSVCSVSLAAVFANRA
jgi:hypothetical protein